jgi:hypothetical protein
MRLRQSPWLLKLVFGGPLREGASRLEQMRWIRTAVLRMTPLGLLCALLLALAHAYMLALIAVAITVLNVISLQLRIYRQTRRDRRST